MCMHTHTHTRAQTHTHTLKHVYMHTRILSHIHTHAQAHMYHSVSKDGHIGNDVTQVKTLHTLPPSHTHIHMHTCMCAVYTHRIVRKVSRIVDDAAQVKRCAHARAVPPYPVLDGVLDPVSVMK